MAAKTITVRRVGAVTFGITLIGIGILFLIHVFFPAFPFFAIYKFWPVILILLGIEVLIGSRKENNEVFDEQGNMIHQNKVVYDVPAIVLMITLIGFSMCMALGWFSYETGLLVNI